MLPPRFVYLRVFKKRLAARYVITAQTTGLSAAGGMEPSAAERAEEAAAPK